MAVNSRNGLTGRLRDALYHEPCHQILSGFHSYLQGNSLTHPATVFVRATVIHG